MGVVKGSKSRLAIQKQGKFVKGLKALRGARISLVPPFSHLKSFFLRGVGLSRPFFPSHGCSPP